MKQGSIAQPIAHLATDPGVTSSNPSSALTIIFLEIDHEIISMVILPLLEKKGSCQLLAKGCAQVLQSTLFIPTLDTTTKFVMMTI